MATSNATPIYTNLTDATQASFADTLNAMREWLDRRKCYLSHFRHVSGDDGTVVISAGFPTADDPASMNFTGNSAALARPKALSPRVEGLRVNRCSC